MAYTTSKKRLLKKSSLYLILDKNSCRYANPGRISKIIENKSVDIIQLRDKFSPKIEVFKQALLLRRLTKKHSVLFIVNDFADIAKIAGADGVHLGSRDTSIGQARRLLGRGKIIGVTCRSQRQVSAAKAQGADYVSFGPVFQTSTKAGIAALGLQLLKKIKSRKLDIPLFAIGGINQSNLNAVLASGVSRIAVCAAICRSASPLAAARKLKSQLLSTV
jgi:thiamine-phosphate pyrophosphorylase